MCTGIFIKTEDGKIIFSRTLEFGRILKTKIYKSYSVKGVQYADTEKVILIDGVNKYGLAVMALWFPKYAKYSKYNEAGYINLNSWDLVKYILDNYKKISDIPIDKIRIKKSKFTEWNQEIPLHWMVADRYGNCVVWEPLNDGVITSVDNSKYKVLTNSPSFVEHISSLKKYHYLSRDDKQQSVSEGSGGLGLPGDYTSESRFIKAHFLVSMIYTPKNVDDGIVQSNKILNNFDIPIGTVYNPETKYSETTQYKVIYDLSNFEIYFDDMMTYSDSNTSTYIIIFILFLLLFVNLL